MGEVYLAQDSKLDRKVALKFLSNEFGQNEQFRKRFTREAQAAAKLNHPNIVTVHEVGEYQNNPFIAMTFVKGESLDAYAKKRKLTIREIIDIGIQISEGLIAAHSQGITHRDLKPANIIIDENENVHILDFGLAIFGGQSETKNLEKTLTKLTEVGSVIGTVQYMSPEQLRGQSVDHLSDIFSLGVILHELTCGVRPFSGSSAAEISSSVLRDQPKPVSDIRADAPYDLQRIIGRCLQKDPARRFQTSKDIRNELEELKTGDSAKLLVADLMLGQPHKVENVSEGSFVLTADLVRKLETRSPKMIGAGMAYVVNNVRSDTLMIVIHGVGGEHSDFATVINKLPCTCVAFTLFGWDWNAKYRPALSLADHSIILREFFQFCQKEFRAKRVILMGFSSGADNILQMLLSPEGLGLKVDGVLLIACNIDLSTCLVTAVFAQMETGNESSILATLTKLGAGITSLNDWVGVQTYLVAMIQRFGGGIEAVKRYSADIVNPFKADNYAQFPQRYKAVKSKIPFVRFVFTKFEFSALDRVLGSHLEDNVLGDDYSEKSIIRVEISHFQLERPEALLKQALSFLKEFDQQLGLSSH